MMWQNVERAINEIMINDLHLSKGCMTNQDREVVENTQPRVKTISKLTNFKIKSQIDGYIGK